MEVVVVGTGGAAGWPEPGCGCASCAPARAAGLARAPTAVRLDDVPLEDILDDTVVNNVRAVTGRDGARLLYAPAGIEPDAVGRALAAGSAGDRAFDLVLLGPRGPGIGSIALALATLRAHALVTARTDIVVVGLSHDDPPPAELARLLDAWGARTVPDGTVLRVEPGPTARTRPAHKAPHPSRSGLRGRTLVLGGARSGKSAYAEALIAAEPLVTYLATGGTRADDPEWVTRVAAHRSRRPAGWTTVESTDIAAVLAAATHPVLLDCLGTWLTARLDHHGAWDRPDARGGVAADVAELLAAWRALTVPVVAVSNEVGGGVVPATASGRLFRDLLGELNTAIAAQSETVLLTVAGLTVALRTLDTPDGSGARILR